MTNEECSKYLIVKDFISSFCLICFVLVILDGLYLFASIAAKGNEILSVAHAIALFVGLVFLFLALSRDGLVKLAELALMSEEDRRKSLDWCDRTDENYHF